MDINHYEIVLTDVAQEELEDILKKESYDSFFTHFVVDLPCFPMQILSFLKQLC